MAEVFDAQEIKERFSFLRLLEREGVELRRSGPNWVGLCPFHREKSGSFTVHGGSPDHGHCYGCGWNGDVFDFWVARHGGTFVEAKEALASLAAVTGREWRQDGVSAGRVAAVTQKSEKEREKPALPPMRWLDGGEVGTLARLRGIGRDGVDAAGVDRRVGFCMWPQYHGKVGGWGLGRDAWPSWVVTDAARAVAQFRRLDGGNFVTRDGKEIKAWTKGSPTWPIGAGEMGDRRAVLLVEGGADMLAAYHFLSGFGRLGAVAVVAMLGASMRIGDDALGFFEGRRVRIMMDEDEAKVEGGVRAGCEAAARWTAQLTAAGAAVETFSLAGLVRRDGERVKDLNDLAFVDEAVWVDDSEMRAAFFDFDF